jgi:uncharacterized membrane protein
LCSGSNLARGWCAGWRDHLSFVTPDTVVWWALSQSQTMMSGRLATMQAGHAHLSQALLLAVVDGA